MTVEVVPRRRVGRFELRDFLGRGATGDVHLAWDPQDEREVALKLVRLRGTDPDAVHAERHGAELQRRVSRDAPQVAAVFEHGDLEGWFYVAMEHVVGQDLAHLLQELGGRLPPRRAIGIARQLCAVLEVLHGYSTEIGGKRVTRIIHGDLKPENVRIEAGDRVRLLDFGVAKHLSVTRKATRNVFGTYPYTPPERLRSGQVNEASDLWAVGIVLYRMVSGQSPYAGSTPEELERAILRHPPLPLPAECAAPLRPIVERCLAYQAEWRYPSAAELAAALDGAAAGVGDNPDAVALPPPRPSPAATAETELPTAPVGRPRWAPSPATHRTLTPPGDGPSRDATRRTVAPAPASSPPPAPTPTRRTVPPPLPPVDRSLRGRLRRWGRGLPRRHRRRLIGVAAALVLVETCALGSGREVVAELAGGANPDVWGAYRKYRAAASVIPFDLGLGPARRALRASLAESAERVIYSFREDAAAPRLADWERAHRALAAARSLGAAADATRARLYYTQGHVDRIEARSLRDRDSEEAGRRWTDAVYAFEQAASLDREWPDPYLGLARIYAYERFDLERLLDALERSRSRGAPWGKRELAQLADANLRQGSQLQAEAAALAGERAEIQLLYDARASLETAVAGYDRMISFGNARQNRDDARRRLAEIRERLRELRRW
ncbi:MAG TPA: serine/threonine-protein kinase [Thermoanaerobaculia bacterium]|nr:serine/threonine-protein kinase [Thermoanaerobaculia bacterium]